MRTNYHYIVVTIGDNKYFINKDMDYTDDFSNVLRFDSREDALDFIHRRNLQDKDAQVIEIIEPIK